MFFIPLKNAYNLQFGLMIVVLQRKVTWRVEDEDKVNKNFHTKASHSLSQMFKVSRQEGKRPEWIGNNVWNSLLEQWNMPLYRSKCNTAKKIVCLKKVDVCTPEDPLACMNTLFVWYDFHIKFCTNLWLIITSLIYKMFSL